MSTSRFWKLGADSIIIVDAVRVIEETYGLKIAIRQFCEELTTLEALATYSARFFCASSSPGGADHARAIA